MTPLIEARSVYKTFAGRGAFPARALQGVSLSLTAGESTGLVGETGSGKSTLGKVMLGLLAPDHGDVLAGGRPLSALHGRELADFRRRFQMVFQQTQGSLNPYFSVEEILREPLAVHRIPSAEHARRVGEALASVHLLPEILSKKPRQLSGGQRQRLAIARSLILQPSMVVLDEPVSGLDLSVQAQLLEMLAGLQECMRLTYLLISHDLDVVARLCARIAVLVAGRIVESGPAGDVLSAPLHPYTKRLLAARLPDAPRDGEEGNAESEPARGEPPEAGCPFLPGCPERGEDCAAEAPPWVEAQNGHGAACLRLRKP